MNTNRPKPVVLVILDGWGIASPSRHNAITCAKTPVMNHLITTYPAMTLQASAEAVGLPWGEMGNSEVGHLTIGAGKIIYQNFPRITKAIWDGSFFSNEAFLAAVGHIKKNHSRLHLMGLVSSGGVHSYIEHLYALLELAKINKIREVYVHVFLDGRDTSYDSGLNFISRLQERLAGLEIGKIATICGRFYAMDRDNRWERTQKAYWAMVEGRGKISEDPLRAIKDSYEQKVYDEEFEPTVIMADGQPVGKIKDKDAIIFFNFRPDRARQITKAFILPGFERFARKKTLRDIFFVSLIEYDKDLPTRVAFTTQNVAAPLSKVVSDAGLKQLHIAETEKYAHATYFFNGGQEKPFANEEHVLIPSPRVNTYDEEPEMSAAKITDRVLEEIVNDRYDFILINYANPDMVGHTGKLPATIKAVEAVDSCLGKIKEAVLLKDGVLIITADHGNAEELVNAQTGAIMKEHSTNPVPFIVVGKEWEGKTGPGRDTVGADLSLMHPQGLLIDVAPTVLKIMGLEKSKEMEGVALV